MFTCQNASIQVIFCLWKLVGYIFSRISYLEGFNEKNNTISHKRNLTFTQCQIGEVKGLIKLVFDHKCMHNRFISII